MTDARTTEGGERLDRRRFLARSAAVLGSGTALTVAQPAAAATPRAAAPPATRSRPNILVIIVDQMRYPRWFGGAGPQVGLPPNIQRLASSGRQLRSPLHRVKRLHAGACRAADRAAHAPDRLHDHGRQHAVTELRYLG